MQIGLAGNNDTIFYYVQPGDNLSNIIRHYHGPLSLQQQQRIIKQIQADNPQLTNPNRIYPGQALLIDLPQKYCPAPSTKQATPTVIADKRVFKPLMQQWQNATSEEKGWLSAITPVLLGTGAAGFTMIDTTFKTNTSLVTEMAENYNDYKANNITKGLYDSRRQKLLYKLKTKLGPTQRILSGNKPVNEVLRISRSKGTVPIGNINQQVTKMTNLSKYASKGGIVLSVVGLGLACHQIASSDTKQEKNEILVESVSSFGGGLVYGAVLTVLLVATPVGWVAALAIGVGGALTGYGTGRVAKYYYTASGAKIDFASETGVNHLCK